MPTPDNQEGDRMTDVYYRCHECNAIRKCIKIVSLKDRTTFTFECGHDYTRNHTEGHYEWTYIENRVV